MLKTDDPVGDQWENKIVEQGMIDPRQLVPNEDNWRLHPPEQLGAIRGSLRTIGWVAGALVNRRTVEHGWAPDECRDVMIDGHARRKEAIAGRQQRMPYTLISVSPEEEATLLATFDPIAALATADAAHLKNVLDRARTDDMNLQGLLDQIARDAKLAPPSDPEAAEDDASGQNVPERYAIIVECASEEHQAELLTQLTGKGLQCRALVS